jgi:hypothetical protein
MINGSDLFICVVAGLAMPLALLDGYRALAGSTLQRALGGAQEPGWPMLWAVTLLLGPGLFIERMLSSWREGALSFVDGVNAMVIALGWAGLHGFVVLSLARALLS